MFSYETTIKVYEEKNKNLSNIAENKYQIGLILMLEVAAVRHNSSYDFIEQNKCLQF